MTHFRYATLDICLRRDQELLFVVAVICLIALCCVKQIIADGKITDTLPNTERSKLYES